ncbi:uncharacterized protein LOC143299207 isoform X2 [Babylonia areolata]
MEQYPAATIHGTSPPQEPSSPPQTPPPPPPPLAASADVSVDKAVFLYVIAALAFLTSLVLACKYLVCRGKVRALSRRSSSRERSQGEADTGSAETSLMLMYAASQDTSPFRSHQAHRHHPEPTNSLHKGTVSIRSSGHLLK